MLRLCGKSRGIGVCEGCCVSVIKGSENARGGMLDSKLMMSDGARVMRM